MNFLSQLTAAIKISIDATQTHISKTEGTQQILGPLSRPSTLPGIPAEATAAVGKAPLTTERRASHQQLIDK
ncbi:hypothetical protein NPIL_415951 [Nephila pilipes]|uniref:Uncharacterized protein n=1 Tax=Nephila pilipes TaxID=299642 RepID=A0A8X6QZ02_NEPPI|nr:hypothetical protein NPIL_415951 [Nephila pilipes]